LKSSGEEKKRDPAVKEFLFQKRKELRRFLNLQGRRIGRIFLKTRMSRAESFKVPIIINNRNRLEWMRALVDWLRKAGYTNIYVLDNSSTYPPLMAYYESGAVKLLRRGNNGGYMSLWSSEYFGKFRNAYYVYTDPDVLPGDNCPPDVVHRLYKVLDAHGEIEKCGVALRIDDLPDHYARKKEVRELIEGRYWKKEIGPGVFDAPVDTTFALYRPLAHGNAEECRAFRLAGQYTWRHMPWYENSSELGAETLYYLQHADASSTWYTKKK
jgi:hypothetical protein